jgi:hypothetical protein
VVPKPTCPGVTNPSNKAVGTRTSTGLNDANRKLTVS